MNCPSRTDEVPEHDGWNQNPPSLTGDLTTRADLNGISNLRLQRDHLNSGGAVDLEILDVIPDDPIRRVLRDPPASVPHHSGKKDQKVNESACYVPDDVPIPPTTTHGEDEMTLVRRFWLILRKFGKFVGPGFMVSVAYIDPGNYSTDVAAGSSTKFKLLFIVLMSNVFAIVLQTLAVRLGTITGMDLAQSCRAFLPRWLNLFLYIMAEAAIIATDIAEVSLL